MKQHIISAQFFHFPHFNTWPPCCVATGDFANFFIIRSEELSRNTTDKLSNHPLQSPFKSAVAAARSRLTDPDTHANVFDLHSSVAAARSRFSAQLQPQPQPQPIHASRTHSHKRRGPKPHRPKPRPPQKHGTLQQPMQRKSGPASIIMNTPTSSQKPAVHHNQGSHPQPREWYEAAHHDEKTR